MNKQGIKILTNKWFRFSAKPAQKLGRVLNVIVKFTSHRARKF